MGEFNWTPLSMMPKWHDNGRKPVFYGETRWRRYATEFSLGRTMIMTFLVDFFRCRRQLWNDKNSWGRRKQNGPLIGCGRRSLRSFLYKFGHDHDTPLRFFLPTLERQKMRDQMKTKPAPNRMWQQDFHATSNWKRCMCLNRSGHGHAFGMRFFLPQVWNDKKCGTRRKQNWPPIGCGRRIFLAVLSI